MTDEAMIFAVIVHQGQKRKGINIICITPSRGGIFT